MNNKKNDLWLNIYVFLLLPFCVIINFLDLYKYIKYFNNYDNLVISILLIVISIVSILLYSYTFYYAKDRVKKSYNLLMITIVFSVIVASFNQVLATYYNQGFKFYLMFLLYIVLFTCFWGLPNYVYLKNRKDMFILNKIMTKEQLKEKIERHIKSQENQKNELGNKNKVNESKKKKPATKKKNTSKGNKSK